MSRKLCSTCPGGHLDRRGFLRVGSLSALGLGLSQFLRLREAQCAAEVDSRAKAKSVILLWQEGGASQVDSWDPKPNSSFKTISTNVPGIQVGELFPKVARQMDKIAFIRSMHTERNNHTEAVHYAQTGHDINPAMKFPSWGSVITKELGPQSSIPPYVTFRGMSATYKDFFKGHIISAKNDPMFLPGPEIPKNPEEPLKGYEVPDLVIPDHISQDRIEDRRTLLGLIDRQYRRKVEIAEFTSMDSYTEQAWNMILSPEVRSAFDLSKESDKTREAYGKDEFGQSALLARRLVEAGSRFVTAQSMDWDTHSTHDKKLQEDLAPSMDRTLPALLDDLDSRGLLETTIVVVMGEFGRTADINFDGGRDHWPECWSIALAGGGIRGGQVVGKSDEKGAYVAERMVTMGDLHATIYKALGIDWTKTYMHPVGRPVKIANSINDETGEPIGELI